jgi:hypothetical protein
MPLWRLRRPRPAPVTVWLRRVFARPNANLFTDDVPWAFTNVSISILVSVIQKNCLKSTLVFCINIIILGSHHSNAV